MKLNQDKVPVDLEDALNTIKEGLTPADIEEIKRPDFNSVKVHFTVGRSLRNEWSLEEKDTVLVQWFKQTYGVDHADDISGIILECLTNDIRNEPRRDKELAKTFIEHWKKKENQ